MHYVVRLTEIGQEALYQPPKDHCLSLSLDSCDTQCLLMWSRGAFPITVYEEVASSISPVRQTVQSVPQVGSPAISHHLLQCPHPGSMPCILVFLRHCGSPCMSHLIPAFRFLTDDETKLPRKQCSMPVINRRCCKVCFEKSSNPKSSQYQLEHWVSRSEGQLQ